MKKLSIIMILLVGAFQMLSASSAKAEADVAYQANNFKEAIEKYEAILATERESADIYYNLGNSYYKDKNIAKAVLNYERALLLEPGNTDIRFNLDMARGKTVDQVTPVHEIFIVTWVNAIANLMSERGWATTAIASFVLILALLCLYIFSKRLVLKKAGFVGALVFLAVCVCANLLAKEQKSRLTNRTGAIVMASTITVKSTPNESGTDLFVLHEGTKVSIEDNSMKAWKEIRLEDGKKGWIPASAIELI